MIIKVLSKILRGVIGKGFIITQNPREEKHPDEVTWKSKAQVCYSMINNLVHPARVLVPSDQLKQIDLRNERKDLLARDLTAGSLTTVWLSSFLERQEFAGPAFLG